MSTRDPNGGGPGRATTPTGHLPLLLLASALLASGLLAVALGVSGQFLPHDERFLGMTAEQLCARHGCRIVHFMVHDRVAFGGALAAVGLLYLWLVRSPLQQGQAWAWWALGPGWWAVQAGIYEVTGDELRLRLADGDVPYERFDGERGLAVYRRDRAQGHG
jgi:hypothetical protein